VSEPAPERVAVDTSISVPLLVETHHYHRRVAEWATAKPLVLTAQSLAETYSVLTRLPDGLRIPPQDVVGVIDASFADSVLPKPATLRRLPSHLSQVGASGGAVYDALVALAALDNKCVLATRDFRARDTYERVGVRVEFVP